MTMQAPPPAGAAFDAFLRDSAPGTPLVHDFAGFDRRYFEMTCPTPDAGGLDHGAWVPLKVMYPDGDVPVLQLSMPTHDPERLLDIGRRLRPLRAVPTVEHYTPLFVTLGAATDAERPVRTTIEGYFIGLSKRSFQGA
jgi:aromatic ring-opening dioxygenase catalytic subunit (LigB family)